MIDALLFIAHWSLIGVLLLFFIGAMAHMMGLIIAPRRWKIAALILLGILGLTTIIGAIFLIMKEPSAGLSNSG